MRTYIPKNKMFIFLGIVLFYVIFLLISDASKFFDVITNLNLLLVPLILLIHTGAIIVRSIRQKIMLDSLDVRISFKNNMKIHVASLSMIVTPGASGEMIKSFFLKKIHNYPYSKTIPTVLFEKYHDLLAVTSILIVISFFAYLWEAQIAIPIFVIFLIFGFIIIRNKKILLFLTSKLPKRWIFKKLVEDANDYHDSLYHLSTKKVFLQSWFFGTISWALDCVVVYLGFLALNVNYSFAYSNLITYTAVVVGTLSFIPGGIGITEAGMTGLLVKSGLTLSTSTAVVILVRMTTTWFTTMLGMISIRFAILK